RLDCEPGLGLDEQRTHLGEDGARGCALALERRNPLQTLEHGARLVHTDTVVAPAARVCAAFVPKGELPSAPGQLARRRAAGVVAARGRRPRSVSSRLTISLARSPPTITSTRARRTASAAAADAGSPPTRARSSRSRPARSAGLSPRRTAVRRAAA